VVLRRGWLKLFGPVLFYDLVRTARRHQLLRARILYALLLLTVLLTLWLAAFLDKHDDFLELFDDWQLPANQIAELNLAVTCIFLALQLFVAFLLTPAYVAGAIVEEKQRRTLEFLLATDLRNRESSSACCCRASPTSSWCCSPACRSWLSCSSWAAATRSCSWRGFLATGLTVLSLGGVAILCSVLRAQAARCHRPPAI